MIKLDARRLTGINVIWKHPGAVVDVRLNDSDDVHEVIRLWNHYGRQLLEALGWREEQTIGYPLHSGVALAISAPMDALYAAVEAAEWLYRQVALDINHEAEPRSEDAGGEAAAPHLALSAQVHRLKALIEEESNPSLERLLREARHRNVTVLCDDDDVSIGLGKHATTWPVQHIPDTIDWTRAADVPCGLVTGTNGKTTTVRLTQRMLRAGDKAVGISSTDWIGVNDTIIDRGDYSGPGGARTVLRQPVDAAILETARGGLLRRGLGVPRADVALITNIAEDHLGDFGSENLDELLNLKWIVTKALDERSVAVLNADDKLLTAKSSELSVPICWFSANPDNPLIASHIHTEKPVVTVKNQRFARFDGSQWHFYCRIDQAPLTVGGSARHNVANALGAIALAHALGASEDDINTGLTGMQPNDNPGRCNFFKIDGVDVLLDFAHNPSAMEAIFDIASSHQANRRLLCFGQAGDRVDNSIRELGRLAWAIGLDHVFIAELADYRRGREENEVYNLLCEGLTSGGASSGQISHHAYEKDCLAHALDQAQPGDLVIMLALAESRDILKWLTNAQARSA